MLKLKVSLENDTRLFKYEGDSLSEALEQLKLFVSQVFEIEKFRLQFCDEEDDLVTIVVPQDLDDALEFVKSQNKTLKIFVIPSVDEVQDMTINSTIEEKLEIDNKEDDIDLVMTSPELENTTATTTATDSTSTSTTKQKDDNLQSNDVTQNIIELLVSDETFRQEFAAFLQDILLQIREGDNLETSIHTALAAHESLSLGPLQNIIPLVPFLSAKEAFLTPFLANIDPNSVPKLIEDFVNSLPNGNGSFNLPPFLQMFHPGFGGLCNGMNMPWFRGGMSPHGHGNHHRHHHHHHPPKSFGFNRKKCHGHQWRHGKNKKCENKKKKNFRAEIIRDDITLADRAVVLPNQSIVKTWKIQNSGTLPFPEGTQLVYVGRPMNVLIDGVKFPVPQLQVGEESEVSVLLTTPNQSGRYACSWRLKLPDKTAFGPMLRARVIVAKNESDEKSSDSDELDITDISKIETKLYKLKKKREKVIKRLESLDSKIEKLSTLQSTETVSTQTDLDFVVNDDDDDDDDNNNDNDNDNDIEFDLSEIEHGTFQEQLTALQNMGFINFDLNQSLLAKHHGNMDDVLNALCELRT